VNRRSLDDFFLPKSMGGGSKTKAVVVHRAKHDTKSRRKARKLADPPAMKELSRMVDAGEVRSRANPCLSEEGAEAMSARLYPE
jgi:hypothetical protein